MSAKLSQLTPYVVKVFDYGYDRNGDLPFFVLEYVSGGDLRSLIGKCDWENACRIFNDCITALSVAHAHDVIHSDVSPDNILLDKSIYKVNDFGLAKQITSALMSRAHSVSLTGGKPRYLPPDHWHNNIRNEYSDLYGLAMVLYELITGEVPQFNYSPASGQLIPPNWHAILMPLRTDKDSYMFKMCFDGLLSENSILAVSRKDLVTDKTMARVSYWFEGMDYHVRLSRNDLVDVMAAIFTRKATTTSDVVSMVRKEIVRYAKITARSIQSRSAKNTRKKRAQ